MSETQSSREESKRETREALILAGIDAFAEDGLDTPSLDGICARAGRTRGAFYVHFRDREDFVVQVMDRVIRGFVAMAMGDEAEERGLIPTVHRYVAMIDAAQSALAAGLDPSRAAATLQSLTLQRALEACSRSDAVRFRFVELVEDAIRQVADETRLGQSDRTVRTDIDATSLATLLVAIALGAGLAIETGVRFDLQRISPALLELISPSKRS